MNKSKDSHARFLLLPKFFFFEKIGAQYKSEKKITACTKKQQQ
jgi:hypothetical protein